MFFSRKPAGATFIFQNELDKIKKRAQQKKSANDLFFQRIILPENIEAYKQLQEEIAKIFPNEYDRPTIKLTIIGNARFNPEKKGKPDLALMGGVGPLSDAHVICGLVDDLKKKEAVDNMHVVLLSAPPPRAEAKIGSSARYLRQIIQFTRIDAGGYAMLSNTAHINADRFKSLLKYPNRFIHLVDHLSKNLLDDLKKSQQTSHKILILGTTLAADKKLYPNILSNIAAKMKHIAIKSVLPDAKHQVHLQNYIYKIKAGMDLATPEQNGKSIGENFLNLLHFLITKEAHDLRSSCQVVLACTEIPLFLATMDKKSGKTYGELLDARLTKVNQARVFNNQIGFKDSEATFIDALSSFSCPSPSPTFPSLRSLF